MAGSFRAPQFYLCFGLIAAAAISRLAQGWLGGALQAILDVRPDVMVSDLGCGVVAKVLDRVG